MSMKMVAQVRDFSKSKGHARFLLVILASHQHPITGLINPSLNTLAHETTFSKPHIIKLIRDLERLDELEVSRGHGRGHTSRYRIILDHEPPRQTGRKGQQLLHSFPEEKVHGATKKVNSAPEKGKHSIYPKEILERKREKRVAHAPEQPHRCVGFNHTDGRPHYCDLHQRSHW